MTYTDPEDLEPDEQQESNDLRNLRNKAKRADVLEKEVETAQAAVRELAFLKAGIETDTPLGQLFMRAYDGELDTDAIKASYSELGGGSKEEEEPAPDPAIEGTRERQALATGAASDTGEAPAPPVRGVKGAAVKAGLDALANGAPRDDAMGATFGALTAAAASGDRSVIVPGIGEGPA